jgi:hypothetical protein
MTTSASAVKARVLRRDPVCAVWAPPAREGEPGSVVYGTARIFEPRDPLGLALHGPAVTTAMTALAAGNVPTLVGYAQDLVRLPARWWPQNRVVLRVTIHERRELAPPGSGDAPAADAAAADMGAATSTDAGHPTGPERGIAPALPTVVPTDIRRGLGGRRSVVLATTDGDELAIAPAVWGSGFSLTVPADHPLPSGASAAAAVDTDPRGRPTAVMGASVRGQIDDQGALEPQRVTWWDGFEIETRQIPAAASRGVTLPD